ncbi:MAG: efflux RND transporter periplasmic adaptor subunit, partial [Chromatiales bacterium]|nr:efflux RND transporter periplasmic adaptor subunit [Chromatiales bacterium]
RDFYQAATLLALISLSFALSAAETEQATLVEVSQVSTEDLNPELTLNGILYPDHQVSIGTQVAGYVATIHVESGDRVEQGQVLVEIRDLPLRLQIDEVTASIQHAKAEVRLRQLEMQRLGELLKTQAVPQGTYDQAVTTLAQAQATLESTRAQRERLIDQRNQHRITAPFSGVITQRFIEAGAWVNPGSSAFELTSQQQLHLEAALPQSFIQRIQVGSRARALFEGQQQLFSTHITRIIPQADNSRSLRIWLPLANPQQQLIPGMAAQVILQLETDHNYPLRLHRNALLRRSKNSAWVWKLVDGQVEAAQVYIGDSLGEWVLVNSENLSTGDQVVVKGNENLRPGQAVFVRPQ